MNNYFNNLIKKLNIVKVIKSFVDLKICGNNYRGYSPFKKENNPSFMVSTKKNIWKDFSSGKGGNLVKFIMYLFNYNYNEAVTYLINRYYKKKYNIKNNTNINKIDKISVLVNKILKSISSLYSKFLLNNKYVYRYLLERNINYSTIKKFKIGYSPNNININLFLKKKNIKKKKILINLGIFTKIKNRYYYLFRNRIMFPIKNIDGYIIGFGGRILDLLIKKNKYINSSNGIVFNKSKVLYGLYENREEIAKSNL